MKITHEFKPISGIGNWVKKLLGLWSNFFVLGHLFYNISFSLLEAFFLSFTKSIGSNDFNYIQTLGCSTKF
jgi:hypothetical protein